MQCFSPPKKIKLNEVTFSAVQDLTAMASLYPRPDSLACSGAELFRAFSPSQLPPQICFCPRAGSTPLLGVVAWSSIHPWDNLGSATATGGCPHPRPRMSYTDVHGPMPQISQCRRISGTQTGQLSLLGPFDSASLQTQVGVSGPISEWNLSWILCKSFLTWDSPAAPPP